MVGAHDGRRVGEEADGQEAEEAEGRAVRARAERAGGRGGEEEVSRVPEYRDRLGVGGGLSRLCLRFV